MDFSKLLITGSNGMVGSAIKKLDSNIICLSRDIVDLRDEKRTLDVISFYRPKFIIHLAARVGGVKANSDFLGDFFIDNIRINSNVLHAAKESKVEKVVSLLSTCIYPDKCTYPLTENQIHNGPPHKSNYAYAYTKRMLDIQSQAYRDQFGCNFVTVVPNNLYGLHDMFDLENSHVIPAIIRKIYEAKQNNCDVTLWGDGSPLREFTYSTDLAKILIFILEEYNGREPINVGNTQEYSIKYVAEMVAEIFNFKGKLIWDISKPSGQFRKPSSNEIFLNLLESYGKKLKYTSLENGLKQVCNWFENSYGNIRGI